MKIGLIQFPGSNCERETALAVRRAGMIPIDCYWHCPADKITSLDGYIIVGGFSYEDRRRSGVLASLEPIIKTLASQTELGKPLLGICNGAQILVESGLVPGLENYILAGALSKNLPLIQGVRKPLTYQNDWCYLKASNSNHAFTNLIKPGTLLHIPYAHAEGRFILPDALINEMKNSHASYFQYVDHQGDIIEEAPVNPNGSIANLAAISNLAGNVMAMMPHPERCIAGDIIFSSMHAYLKNKNFNAKRYNFTSTTPNLLPFPSQPNCHEFMVKQFIEDNTARSLELALANLGFQVKAARYTYWGIQADIDYELLREQIHSSAELYNPSKATLVDIPTSANTLGYLISDKENNLGKQKLKVLKKYFNLSYLQNISHGEILCFTSPTEQIEKLKTFLAKSHLLFNPYGETGYVYDR